MAAYGMVPMQMAGSSYMTGGFDQFAITLLTAVDIFYGDLVRFDAATGTVIRGVAPVAATPALGVFVGCRYVNESNEQKYAQHYVGSSVAGNRKEAYAYVVTDPDVVFKIQGQYSTAAAFAQAEIGQIVNPTVAAGSTTTGLSGNYVDLDDAGADSKALRVIGLVENGSNEAPAGGTSTTYDILVKWNPVVTVYGSNSTAA